MGYRKDIIGNIYGKLKVVKYAGNTKHRHSKWECLCECGKTVTVEYPSLESGNTKSCGCSRNIYVQRRKNKEKGGEKRVGKLYWVWAQMLYRCYKEDHPHYKNYGGRGISVCDAWKSSYENFRVWAHSTGYSEHLSLDRLNNDKDYSPDNCRWATQKEQVRNRRNTLFILFNGEVKRVVEWAEEFGLSWSMAKYRLLRNGGQIIKGHSNNNLEVASK